MATIRVSKFYRFRIRDARKPHPHLSEQIVESGNRDGGLKRVLNVVIQSTDAAHEYVCCEEVTRKYRGHMRHKPLSETVKPIVPGFVRGSDGRAY